MSFKDKLLNTKDVTRRTFLKGASAVGATAALYGCGGGSSSGKTYMDEDDTIPVPQIKEEIIAGGTPHNCGGRCVSRYYVKDGVVKRIVTDERGDKTLAQGDNPEFRSCVRCHSRKQWFYRNDRLLYPLKQTGERGDVNGFQRISWDQAFTEIAAKMEDVVGRYGNKGIHSIYSSGDQSGWARNSVHRMLGLYGEGGYTYYFADYSFPALEYVAPMVEGTYNYLPMGNSIQDGLRSDNIVMWGYNPNEMIQYTSCAWELTQVRESGKPVTVIDTRYSKSASVQADDFVSILPGTDAALIIGMLHYLLSERLADLDIPFIQKYMYGFFEVGESFAAGRPANSAYTIADGGSLSAFIMGDDDTLVTANLNRKKSIYPNTIGYNVNADDDLHGKTVGIYGQKAKDIHWAEKITGIPAAKIKELADMYLDTKVNTFIGGGYQRHTESEQAIWLHRVLSVVTKNFGSEGCGSGYPSNSTSSSAPNTNMSAPNNVKYMNYLYDEGRVSDLTYVPYTQRYQLPVFVVPDALDNAGKGKSKWNDGQVRKIHEGFGKIIFEPGGNTIANQSGDVNYNKEIFKDRSKCEMIVCMDHFMTASAAMADYILPSTMQGEKPAGLTTGEGCLRVSKVHDIPGEVMDEYSICAGIAGKLGFKDEYLDGYGEGQEGMEARVKDGWETGGLTEKYNMTYDEWVEQGIASNYPFSSSSYTIVHKSFHDDPVANPLNSASGKFEAYCGNLIEDYEARHHDNIDGVTTDDGGVATLYNTGSIYTAYANAEGNLSGRRFVYPIPMYIPTVEGHHAIDFIDSKSEYCHDDPLGLNDAGYNFTLHTWHLMYRSHSTLNNVAYLSENFKKDANGTKAFLDPSREWGEGVWDDNVYEPMWISAAAANKLGITNGDRVLVSNSRGKMYASAVVTQRVPEHIVALGQGSWHKLNAEDIDVGGCANTVVTARPSRICRGMTSANDTRVKIEKA